VVVVSHGVVVVVLWVVVVVLWVVVVVSHGVVVVVVVDDVEDAMQEHAELAAQTFGQLLNCAGMA